MPSAGIKIATLIEHHFDDGECWFSSRLQRDGGLGINTDSAAVIAIPNNEVDAHDLLDVREGIAGGSLVEVNAEIAVEQASQKGRLARISSRCRIALPGNLAEAIGKILRGGILAHPSRCDRGGNDCSERESDRCCVHSSDLHRRWCSVHQMRIEAGSRPRVVKFARDEDSIDRMTYRCIRKV